ncbi:hypothetical protein TMU01_12010 [Tenuibacillus multivorans]|nr:hypothetical protein TMU01_12010 [Tenuibacillus multivorans]
MTNSTVAPFSEKLMLFHTEAIVSTAIGFYGVGLSVAQRRDIAGHYSKLIAEMGLYAELIF